VFGGIGARLNLTVVQDYGRVPSPLDLSMQILSQQSCNGIFLFFFLFDFLASSYKHFGTCYLRCCPLFFATERINNFTQISKGTLKQQNHSFS
jgi:hypothetical protein